MNDKDISEKQAILQSEAKKVLDALGILTFLSEFGRVEVVGSYALGLMTWRDVDIDLAVDEIREDDFFQAVRFMFGRESIKRLVLADNRNVESDLADRGIPASLYLGVFVAAVDGGEWKIDIRFVEGGDIRTKNYLEQIKSRLTDEKRLKILEIKDAVCLHPKYQKKEICGVDVYTSVLDDGVTDVEGFEKFLARKGIELSSDELGEMA